MPSLRKILLHTLSFGAHALGWYDLGRLVRARRRLTCVFYHDVVDRSPVPEMPLFIETAVFWRHVKAFARRYTTVGFADLRAEGPLPAYPLMISFDGYSSGYLPVAEALAAKGLKAVFYLLTEPIQSGRPHWRQRLYWLLRGLAAGPFSAEAAGETFTATLPGTAAGNLGVARRLADLLERDEDPHAACERVADRAGVDLAAFDAAYRPLTVDEVRAMAAMPGIEIGSHSHRHAVRPDLSADEARRELDVSRALLSEWTGRQVVDYAYPSGAVHAETLRHLAEAGYATAATTVMNLHEPYAAPEWPYQIPRYGLGSGPFYLVAGQLAGVHGAIDRLGRAKRGMRRRHG